MRGDPASWENLRDAAIECERDLRALRDALRSWPLACPKDGQAALEALSTLVEEFEDEVQEGEELNLLQDVYEELSRILDLLCVNPGLADKPAAFRILRLLAATETQEGTEAVLDALGHGLHESAWEWSQVYDLFREGHVERETFLEALRDQLPQGVAGEMLLDLCQQIASRDPGWTHLFDSKLGHARLEAYLRDEDPGAEGAARAAAATAAFLSGGPRANLISLAVEHRSRDVALEGAWAMAKLGLESGFELLARSTLDWRTSRRASTYLEAFGQQHRIPAAARDADLQARAEFAEHLSKPAHLRCSPTRVDIIDTRTLRWPPDGEPRTLRVLEFEMPREQELPPHRRRNRGLTGSVCHCLFDPAGLERPVEDLLAMHACWEIMDVLIESVDLSASRLNEEQVAPEGIELQSLEGHYTIDPQLGYPHAEVRVYRAHERGTPGFAILENADGTFYRDDARPATDDAERVLQIHIGRRLLNLEPKRGRAVPS